MSKNESSSEILFDIFKEPNGNRFLIILVGIPASGKSVFAYEFKSFLIKNGINEQSIKIIDTDQIRTELFGITFNPDNESVVINEKYKIIKQLSADIHVRFIIIDDLNYLTSQRKILHDIANNHGLIPFVIFFDCPLEIALKNNEKRTQNCIPDYVISRIHSKLDIPGKKYAWDKFDYQYHCTSEIPNKKTFEDILKLMKFQMESKINREKSFIGYNTTNKRSDKKAFDYHRIDLITRKIIAKIIQENRKKIETRGEYIDDKKEKTNKISGKYSNYDPVQLNKIRQEFLLYVKQNNIIDSRYSEGDIEQLFFEFCAKRGSGK